MSDMLSQDEIDALLRGTPSNDEPQDSDAEEILDDMEIDALGEVGNISLGNSATALSALLNQKVEITTPHVRMISMEELRSRYPIPHVALRVGYTEGFKGENVLILTQRDASVIANLMMGGDGVIDESLEMEPIALSAVQEAMNQMMGAAATSMSTVFSMRIDISPPAVEIFDFSQDKSIVDSFSLWESMVIIEFDLKIGTMIDSKIVQLAPLDFSKQLIQKLFSASTTQQAEPAPQATAQAQPEQPQPQAQPTPAPAMEQRTVVPPPEPKATPVGVSPVQFSQLGEMEVEGTPGNIGMLYDVPLNVTVELGRTRRSVRDILELTQGSVIELDKLAGEPVDVLVNNTLIATGEVVVIEENFGVRITEIVNTKERLRMF
ncbi:MULTISPECIES: flagellar motor switch phosphatase FliY [Exiguobacterium]|uniref:Flagellar motor switch phosphatase FliY n=1 Tax=Exiguobacterium acetylicum TaxID=41170 RepID=A0ABX8G685_EXIAC|nr:MULTISPECIES: flagellar motor switch phosphatase FliY [Exiguobacterium]AOT01069.1 flagellar motor switch phosphatase FliY [Exiguobacterium sp. U13-1]QWB29023.1 flagellar motor switch phosphatase FliY [Exiguobacterium acetylicum]HCD59645.1 flagellar motor switch phosphatase FliY [Exiguobacterium sp.]